MENTIVFIDAGYLSVLSKYFGEGKRLKLNIERFAKYLASKKGLQCEHIFYYTAPPFQSNAPTEDEARFKAGYDSFVSKLKRCDKLTLREGRVQKIGNSFNQKGVDTLLTLDLYEQASIKKYSNLILVACDTDFVPVLNRIRGLFGVKIILFYFTDRKRGSSFSLSNHILTAVDEHVLLAKQDLTSNLLETKK